jgi:integrase/recombinase XerC
VARRLAGSAALVLVEGATPLRPEPALFEAMIEGWCRQHSARRLSPTITKARVSVVRRFQAFTGFWPWQWTPEQIEAWVAQGEWAHSTIRAYQGSLALFMDYVCDPRYGWIDACVERVGAAPTQICHEWNTAVHVADYEGDPRRRPLSRQELQAFFDAADDRVEAVVAAGRKGALATFRDATLFKVIYGWGLRRREAAMLDTVDFSTNPAAPELGHLGVVSCPLGQVVKGQPTEAPFGGDADALGCGGAGAVPGRGAAAIFLAGQRVVADRAGRADFVASGR